MTKPHITYFPELIQGSDEWFAARCGLLTASETKLIITPAKLQYASNDKERAHLYELMAQRITGYVEPSYVSDDMLRGKMDELDARLVYEKQHGETKSAGFITNSRWGFTLGYSPDFLAGDDGQGEIKSRRQKYQIETILGGAMPTDYLIQVQTGLLVSERKWCDFISYCGGLPMLTLRVYPDARVQDAIINAAGEFERRVEANLIVYREKMAAADNRLIPTERKIEQEITV
jgi:hypothetical protein